uniref:Uncharacterized protein n=1 Tax=Picea sitchensis TaxID=3332 RepID=D5A9N0_PICSI|nr:unknown [Picea sitchensis]
MIAGTKFCLQKNAVSVKMNCTLQMATEIVYYWAGMIFSRPTSNLWEF